MILKKGALVKSAKSCIVLSRLSESLNVGIVAD